MPEAPATRSYSVVVIGGEGDPATAETTDMVLALFALGIEPLARAPLVETVEEIDGRPVHRHTWQLQAKSADGRHDTDKLRKAWNDPAWFKANPEHPLAYLRAWLIQRRHLVAQLKNSVPLGVVRKGDKSVLIPLDATPEEEAFLLAKLG